MSSQTKTKSDSASSNSKKKDYSKAEVNKKLTAETKIQLYRDMVRIRRFEERSLRYYQQGAIGGFLHLYIGQESVAVGSISVLGENDHIITAYRDHGHALAVGMTMNECMAELAGKYSGCSKGKGGSMHFFAPDKNYWGGHGIVGGQTPLGAGIAFGLKYKGIKGCCLCYMGDGAINQGAYHEALNLSALWKLPVIFIIENNGYSMGTSQARSSAAPESLAQRAEGYNMDWDVVDGCDVYEVRAKIDEAVKRAHEDSTPCILEVRTYRYYGHSVADANHQKYRTKTEIEDYKKNHDPLTLFRNKLIDEGVLNEASAKEIDKEARAEAEESVKFSEASPFPPQESILDDVYWETDNPDKSTSEGTMFFEKG